MIWCEGYGHHSVQSEYVEGHRNEEEKVEEPGDFPLKTNHREKQQCVYCPLYQVV